MAIVAGLVEAEIVFKVVFAAAMGIIIGLEREIDMKPAGLRTHSLVCMGSALFAAISIAFVGPTVDPTRIASGIVTGIGFLGAGAIFVARDKIKGLTTAADLWVLAGVGLAVGVGLYYVALVTTLVVYFTLSLGRYLKESEKHNKVWFAKKRKERGK
ncbi:MAG: MgtC/SapB family protein [Candidatus Aenigmatarchaeota archaeon]